VSVRCRVCHDELVKACAEIAELKREVAGLTDKVQLLTGEVRTARRKARHEKSLRNEAVKRAVEAEWMNGRE
jgi:hypothetical protein